MIYEKPKKKKKIVIIKHSIYTVLSPISGVNCNIIFVYGVYLAMSTRNRNSLLSEKKKKNSDTAVLTWYADRNVPMFPSN